MEQVLNKYIPKKDKPALVFLTIAGILNHFLYEWTGNALIAFFCPVNESVWEHLKLLVFPFLFWSLWDSRNRKQDISSYFYHRLLAVLCGILSVITLFYTYTGVIGKDFFIFDILIFIIAILVTLRMVSWFSTHISKIPSEASIYTAWLALILCFFLFTCFPPDIPLFYSYN